ncbi:MAG: FHA domain-containing protein [Nocardioides sp.]
MKCPSGHETVSTDYCDTCGLAVDPNAQDAGGSTPPADLPPTEAIPKPSADTCPNCQVATPANALFCESCGYDFTTGSLPRPLSSTSSLDLPSASMAGPAPATASAPEADSNPSPAPSDAWVAEIWIDPDWYADQQSTDPLPSPGVPTVVPLKHTSVLIGRASKSRGIHPDLDLDSDSGISRRHAQLTHDGSRWFVEDLGSSNGTYVGGSAGTLPKDPIIAGKKFEIGGGDKVYLGAWTRIVLRKAAPGEV